MATMREIMAAKRAAAAKTAQRSDSRPEATGRTVGKLSSAPTPEEQAILEEYQKSEEAKQTPRNLGERVADVPYVFPSDSDSPVTAAWKKALLAPVTSLGIVIEPHDTEFAWLAIQAEGEAGLMLLHRLPLLNCRQENAPF